MDPGEDRRPPKGPYLQDKEGEVAQAKTPAELGDLGATRAASQALHRRHRCRGEPLCLFSQR